MKLLELREAKQHGSSGFPVELYPVHPRHIQYVMPCHWHAECELIHVDQGSFAYEIESSAGVARPGDMLFVNSGVLHAGIPQESEYRCVVFSLEPLMGAGTRCHELILPFADGRRRVWLHLPGADMELRALARRLMELLARQPEGYELTAQGLLLELLGLIVEKGYCRWCGDGDQGNAKRIRQLKQVLAYLEQEYASPLSLDDLARAAGMSPRYFCDFFKRMTQRTPMEYLNRHRVEVARAKLRAGSQNVTDLAYDCGFNDLSYFIRVFKKYAGTTPKRYAAQAGQG